jgi:transposase
MAGAYSTDLRGRVLAAVEAGATPEAAARRYAVGRSTAYRWATAARTEGRRAAKRMGGGPKPRISGEVEAALLGLLKEANHLTLAECRDRLAERTGVRVHPWTVGRALRCGGAAGRERGGACARPSRIGRTWPPRGRRGPWTRRRAWAGSRRSGWGSWTSAAC